MRPIQAGAAPEVTAIDVERAAVDAAAGAWRSLGLGARSGDLVDMPVERDEGRLELATPADGAAAHRDHGMIGLVMHVPETS